MKVLFFLLLVSSHVIAQQPSQQQRINLDDLGIEVIGSPREVAFTNKADGVFYTQTSGNHHSGWQGWRVMSKEIMEDYIITIDSWDLSRDDVVRSVVYPHKLVRFYSNGVEETVTLLDSVNAFVVQLNNVKASSVTVRPLYRDIGSPNELAARTEVGILVIWRKELAKPVPEKPYPGYIAVNIEPGKNFALAYYDDKPFGQNISHGAIRTVVPSERYTIVFAASAYGKDAYDLSNEISENPTPWLEARKNRIERLLNSSPISTNNPRLDKAVQWAKVSLDALIMNQTKKGIFAGLPWFDNYWGRDSYISLAGATLVTGTFAEARAILRSFASWQEVDPKNPNYGRIPNQVTTHSKSYNTADGTPWFVVSLSDYFTYSADTAFVRDMYPVVQRSIEGSLRHHVDKDYFLTHGEAETWMDAVGPDGPWSPRGNRANDVQALWYRQLRAGAELARVVSPSANAEDARRWEEISDKLMQNFNEKFVDASTGVVYDHLNPDHSPDRKFRPNQLFTWDLIRDQELRRKMFRLVTERLVYPHGVASLWQEDPDFHPYHQYMPFYVKDAAYHNGIVWTWLAGPWIDLATEYGFPDLAFRVTEDMIDQMLERGPAGTIAELLDASPRPTELHPRLSGTFSQAWSLAEFVRTIYQSYLGARVERTPEGGRRLVLYPNLPASLTEARFTVPIGSFSYGVEYRPSGAKREVVVTSPAGALPLEYRLDLNRFHARYQASSGKLNPGSSVVLSYDQDSVTNSESDPTSRLYSPLVFGGIKLAAPVVNPELKSLKGPGHRILKVSDITWESPAMKTVFTIDDPQGDDSGPAGTYTYPLTTHLRPGSLDVLRFSVSADHRSVRFKLEFRELSDPGWHPEYGFQLTYVAIAIDKDGIPGSGQRSVGMNAQYTFKNDFAYEHVVYVGGGIQVRNAQGNILAEYVPMDGEEDGRIGNARTKTIEFSLPTEIIGSPRGNWRYAVLVGCQDDHGGAGIGEFRAVEATATEWTGGGKKRASDSNVYDFTLPPPRP